MIGSEVVETSASISRLAGSITRPCRSRTSVVNTQDNPSPLGLAVTVEFIGPLSVAVLGSRKLIDVVWVVLAGAGIALITPWTAGRSVDPMGVALAFAAGVCWALYIVLGKHVSHLLSSGAAVSIGMLIATVAVVPITAAGGEFGRRQRRLHTLLMMALVGEFAGITARIS